MVSSRRICCNANTLTDFQCLARLFKNKKFPLLCRSTSLLLSRKEKKSIGKISPKTSLLFCPKVFLPGNIRHFFKFTFRCEQLHFFHSQILDHFAKRLFPKILYWSFPHRFRRPFFLLQFAIIKFVLEKRFDCSCLLTIK